MAVAHDAATESAAWNATPDPFTFSHTPSGTPRGVVVEITSVGVTTDLITGVTYGGVAMTRIASAAKTGGGELARVYTYFLGASIPTGTQTVSIDHTETTDLKYATCSTQTASGDTAATVFGTLDASQADPQIAIDSGAASALRYFHIFSGLPNVTDLTLIAGMTAVHSIDHGPNISRTDRETSPSSGNTTVGYTAASDDVVMVAIEVHESGTSHTATPTDNEGLLDSVTQEASYLPVASDVEGLVDSAVQVTDSVRDFTDPLGLVDDVSYQLTSDGAQTFTDPLGLTDSAAQVTDSVRDLTDPLGLVDSVASALSIEVSITDVVGLVDDGEWIAIGADAVGILDTVTVTGTYARDFTDPLGLSDSVSYDHTVGGTGHVVSITDNLGLLDTTATTMALEVSVTDPLGLVDTASTTTVYAPTVTDLLGLLDSIEQATTAPGFWVRNPVAYVTAGAAYDPIEGDEDSPWN